MKEYKLQEKDIKLLEKILKTTKSIQTIYNKILELETKNLKNSEEYNDYLKYLEIVMEVELQEYQELNLTYEKVIACLGYIIKDKGASIYTTISEYLIEGDHDFDPRYRVINNLNNIRRNLEVGIKQVIPKDFTSNLNLLFLDHLQKGEIEVNQIKNQLLRAIENDLDEGYYYFLQELSKKDEFQFLTPLITKTIFDYLFIKGDIRKNDSDSKFMETISTIAYLNKVNGEELGNLKNIKAFSVAMREIASILKISDKEHHNFKTLLSSLQRICRLKSAFLFLDDNHKEEVYQYFNQVIEEELFKDIHPDTKIAQTLIQNSFNDIVKDKEKMITISFE